MFFNAPPVIEARPFTRVPKELELADRHSAWAERMARGALGSFLDGVAHRSRADGRHGRSGRAHVLASGRPVVFPVAGIQRQRRTGGRSSIR